LLFATNPAADHKSFGKAQESNRLQTLIWRNCASGTARFERIPTRQLPGQHAQAATLTAWRNLGLAWQSFSVARARSPGD
jgi:hypothetical protein